MNRQDDWTTRTCVLTGAAGGVGAATARVLAARGARLVLAGRNAAALTALANELRQAHPRARVTTVQADVTKDEDNAAIVEAAAGPIHAVIPSAGVYPESSVAEMTSSEWRKTFAVNIDAVFSLTAAAIPHLAEDSAFVLIGSIAGARGSANHAHYAATKGATVSFARSLALELAPRTRVNVVAPGIVRTPMVAGLVASEEDQILASTPLARLAEPAEIASAAAFLASPDASFITGEVLHVNGGFHMAG
ncbi:SDR family NAD(P)-dependent oxidoreductase [Streptomyces sp. NPDC004250]|uniref:SDR family NAD(P)-dependent oxidoreductase n=1 Tax=Streptomyces sp. NPDC004250 TaxID=3364692 RepID=UPI0036BC81FC